MKHLFTLILLALSSSAFALGWGNDNPSSNQTNLQATSVDVSNRIAADTRAAAQSYAAGGVGQAVASGGSGGSSGASIEVVYPRTAAAVALGGLFPSSPCMGTSSIGGGNGFFNFAAGSSWTDDECGIRETSRSFSGLGKADDALKVLCTSKYAAAAPSCAQAEAK